MKLQVHLEDKVQVSHHHRLASSASSSFSLALWIKVGWCCRFIAGRRPRRPLFFSLLLLR